MADHDLKGLLAQAKEPELADYQHHWERAGLTLRALARHFDHRLSHNQWARIERGVIARRTGNPLPCPGTCAPRSWPSSPAIRLRSRLNMRWACNRFTTRYPFEKSKTITT